MPDPIHIAMYSDVHCPYAYLTTYRLRKLRDEYRGKIVIDYKSLSLEYVNKRPTPKGILDNETPILLLAEPEIPYQPWNAPDTEWPVTMWPAFEAIKCAERQNPDLAAELDWAIRKAFFADSQCISMRHVLLALADQVGLDMQRFTDDFDSGLCKRQVVQESQMGWEHLKVEGSPTFVLPNGKQVSYLALPHITLDENRNCRLVAAEAPPCQGDTCLDMFRRLFDEVLTAAK
jgi:predicted DsbA family dithiol-disulfide isomerase